MESAGKDRWVQCKRRPTKRLTCTVHRRLEDDIPRGQVKALLDARREARDALRDLKSFSGGALRRPAPPSRRSRRR